MGPSGFSILISRFRPRVRVAVESLNRENEIDRTWRYQEKDPHMAFAGSLGDLTVGKRGSFRHASLHIWRRFRWYKARGGFIDY